MNTIRSYVYILILSALFSLHGSTYSLNKGLNSITSFVHTLYDQRLSQQDIYAQATHAYSDVTDYILGLCKKCGVQSLDQLYNQDQNNQIIVLAHAGFGDDFLDTVSLEKERLNALLARSVRWYTVLKKNLAHKLLCTELNDGIETLSSLCALIEKHNLHINLMARIHTIEAYYKQELDIIRNNPNPELQYQILSDYFALLSAQKNTYPCTLCKAMYQFDWAVSHVGNTLDTHLRSTVQKLKHEMGILEHQNYIWRREQRLWQCSGSCTANKESCNPQYSSHTIFQTIVQTTCNLLSHL